MVSKLIDLYDTWLVEHNREHSGKRKKKCFHPSTICMANCALELVMDWYELRQETHPASLLRIFQEGHSVHARIQGAYKEIGILREEVDVSIPEYHIYGKADGVFCHKDQEYVLEIKSIGDKGFKALKDCPKKEHINQVNLYMYGLGINKAVVLYENKNTQEMKGFELEQDMEVVNPQLELCKIAYDIIMGANVTYSKINGCCAVGCKFYKECGVYRKNLKQIDKCDNIPLLENGFSEVTDFASGTEEPF